MLAAISASRFSVSTLCTDLRSGGSHFLCPSDGRPFTKNTNSASSHSAIAVPLPTEPPFATSTTFRKSFDSTVSLIVLSACATRLLKLRDEILVWSSWYISSFSAFCCGSARSVDRARVACGDDDRTKPGDRDRATRDVL